MRQKKGRAGLFERVDYGVSSTKALCVIWTVEGGVKCADVRLALKAGGMLVLRKEHRWFCESRWQRGYGICSSLTDEIFLSRTFLVF